jgi:hypothetical protein
MNFVDGKLLETKDCDAILESLTERISNTLSRPLLRPDTVIDACDRLVSTLDESLYLSAMAGLGIPEELGKSYIAQAREMFSGEALRFRMRKELGDNYDAEVTIAQANAPADRKITERILPIGVILHVAAGNVDGLPAFSVLEGLLTGNINIMKLPAAEGGMSVGLLSELVRIEPALSEYIYVFDYSSKDMIHMNRLIDAADAVALWGGAEAVSAFRTMLPPNIRLIEWGHKVSFAYVTKAGSDDAALAGIAEKIVATGHLLCSSCQGIFLDTDDMDDVYGLCARFLPILENAVREHAKVEDIGVKAQTAMQLYNAELETIFTGNRIFKGAGCSLTACDDQNLEPGIGFGNIWIKPLPSRALPAALRPYKNYLQTVALLCGEEEKARLTEAIFKTGVVRVCSGDRMSETYLGLAHDGEYPLRRYTKTVSAE